jgi:hypothetical protein
VSSKADIRLPKSAPASAVLGLGSAVTSESSSSSKLDVVGAAASAAGCDGEAMAVASESSSSSKLSVPGDATSSAISRGKGCSPASESRHLQHAGESRQQGQIYCRSVRPGRQIKGADPATQHERGRLADRTPLAD